MQRNVFVQKRGIDTCFDCNKALSSKVSVCELEFDIFDL